MSITCIEERVRADGYGDAEPILFYRPRDPYGWMSSFSHHAIILPHPFTMVATRYRSGEYRFQAMKGITADAHDYVLDAKDSSDAKFRGGPHGVVLRSGWGNSYGDLCWYAMAETVIAKTLQHRDVRRWLAATGKRPLYEDSDTDDIWGVRFRNDYRGKNLLGRCWMYARSVIG